jgi:hypothetical protein
VGCLDSVLTSAVDTVDAVDDELEGRTARSSLKVVLEEIAVAVPSNKGIKALDLLS